MPPVPNARNLKELPKFRDGLSYLYVEHAFIEQEAQGIGIYDREGLTLVPVAALGVLFLGPGTRITHAAIRALAGNGCTVCWVGEGLARFYAQGLGDTRSALRLFRQARAWADPALHLEVVYRLYAKRFPEPLPRELSLEQVRGLEGVRVRSTYARWSRETGVAWRGRSYDRGVWTASDPVNRALSTGATYLYGLAHAAIVSLGYSPALGFIHTGKLLSFVYDVADLYKTEYLIPAAFRTVAESEAEVERRVRRSLRERIEEGRLLERMAEDLLDLFSGLGLPEEGDPVEEDPTHPGGLWDPEGEVEGGVNHAGDGPGEGSEEP
jgi:CRISPR-associated protein Cas1